VTRRTFEKKNFLENSKKRKNPENATDKIFTEIKTENLEIIESSILGLFLCP